MSRGRELPRLWPINGIAEENWLVRTDQAARLLAVSPNTLKYWRTRGHRAGPRFIRVESLVRYAVKDLLAYVQARTVESKRIRGARQ